MIFRGCLSFGQGGNVQCAQQKQRRNRDLLLQLQTQTPNHRYREGEDHEVDQQICNPVPPVKCDRVDAGGPGDALVPVGGDRVAFEDGGEQIGDEIEDDDGFGGVEGHAEILGDTEDAIVKQDEGGFEEEGREEVEDLEGHEDLSGFLSQRISCGLLCE